jgi:hypothetical protein
MQVKCPHCGGIVDVVTRAPVGSGTRLGEKLKFLNRNHAAIIVALRTLGVKATVRQVQKCLFEHHIGRFTRQDFRKGTVDPSGQWNYHYVQATLSILVGHGDVEMSAASTRFDRSQGMHDSKPVPTYWVK